MQDALIVVHHKGGFDMINMDYVMGFLKSKGEEEKPKKGGMIMVITVAKPKKVGVKDKKK